MPEESRNEPAQGSSVERKPTLVLDAAAFLAGTPDFSRGRFLTVRGVIDELGTNFIVKARLQVAMESKRLSVYEPSEDQVSTILKQASLSGDMKKLSPTDIQLLATAFSERSRGSRVIMVSDDYSLQNVARQLGIETLGVILPGIKTTLNWLWYCSSCHRVYDSSPPGNCLFCGGEVKRRPVSR